MAIIGAYVLPHPPLVVPSVGRGAENGIKKTVDALNAVAAEIAALKPQTVIFVTPHSALYADYFHISPGKSAKGCFARFGASGERFETEYDTALAEEIVRSCEQSGVNAGFSGERDPRLDHGVTVPMWYINQKYDNYKTIRVSQSGLDARAHERFGQVMAQAVEKTGTRVVLAASGDLSHKLTHDGPYGFAPEGAQFDALITNALSTGDFASLFDIPNELRQNAAECGYGSIMVLAGCLGKHVKSRLLSYEGPFGVGYAVAAVSNR